MPPVTVASHVVSKLKRPASPRHEPSAFDNAVPTVPIQQVRAPPRYQGTPRDAGKEQIQLTTHDDNEHG